MLVSNQLVDFSQQMLQPGIVEYGHTLWLPSFNWFWLFKLVNYGPMCHNLEIENWNTRYSGSFFSLEFQHFLWKLSTCMWRILSCWTGKSRGFEKWLLAPQVSDITYWWGWPETTRFTIPQKGRLIQGWYKPIRGSCAIYLYPGVEKIFSSPILSG